MCSLTQTKKLLEGYVDRIMNLEEYKALMMLELLLSDKDLSEYNYATVDGSGELCCFVDEPHISKVENEMWSNNDKLEIPRTSLHHSQQTLARGID